MTVQRIFLLLLACCWATLASAQYQWLDKDGRKVFSDRPPPLDVPQKNILQEPRLGRIAPARSAPAAPANAAPANAAPSDAPAAGADAAPAADAPAPTAAPAVKPPTAAGTDKALQEAKAKAEAQEQAKKKAEDEAKARKQAQTQADNCKRARQAKAALEPGRLVSTVNPQGERVYMDDATRAAELQRAEQIIASDCK
ncbi:DUF4124 domain-containing protein [Comamonas sp. NLF-1-9]|uniref:DUF4124 domain-containing protein n=1 Tax=Comamonas sp. NLF-1-9 TaxID=2853163 RepID=UPI001C4521D3|nr:DUF4124 domain-containing protein [Comamonas sp. NLF-1-9]QXL85235.1 DUF4124 domain-containing protein [Comamonas sp. NLF-1-9]